MYLAIAYWLQRVSETVAMSKIVLNYSVFFLGIFHKKHA